MGWASLSLRKMQLKQRINEFEQRLVHVSQELQDIHNSGSYAQRVMGVRQSEAKAQNAVNMQNKMEQANQNYQTQTNNGQNVNNQTTADYTKEYNQIQLEYMLDNMMTESIFQTQAQAMQEQANAQETQLELEQEQIQTQLSAARAEYKSLDQAAGQDIQEGAIKLVG